MKPNPARQTFGLAGMHERIATLGGKMKITSSRGKGTRIEVSAPIINTGLPHDRGLSRNTMADGRGLSELRQGVTLEVMGEGNSIGPLNAADADAWRAATSTTSNTRSTGPPWTAAWRR